LVLIAVTASLGYVSCHTDISWNFRRKFCKTTQPVWAATFTLHLVCYKIRCRT